MFVFYFLNINPQFTKLDWGFFVLCLQIKIWKFEKCVVYLQY